MFIINKFPIIIISTRRSGSTPLLYELASKYNVELFNETFSTYSKNTILETVITDQEKLLSLIKNNNDKFILKIHLDDLKFYPDELLNIINNHKCFLIRIKRKNIINQITSVYISRIRSETGYYKNYIDDKKIKELVSIEIPIDSNTIESCVREVINTGDSLDKANYDFDKTVWYEDLEFEDKTFITTPKPINYDEIQNEIKRYFKRADNIMTNRILIMGLPGAGKSILASKIVEKLELLKKTSTWLNDDEVRRQYDDWDFSIEGCIRQSVRMRTLADEALTDYVIADFIAPLEEMRTNYKADWTIWVDTIDEGLHEDTNKMFVKPKKYDFRISKKYQNAEKWSDFIIHKLINNFRRPVFDWKKSTVQMLGCWPWNQKHCALFHRAMAKTGQVVIQIRDSQGYNGTDPFAIDQIKNVIKRDLDMLYQGQYEIQVVPNITNITYRNNVDYTMELETF